MSVGLMKIVPTNNLIKYDDEDQIVQILKIVVFLQNVSLKSNQVEKYSIFGTAEETDSRNRKRG
jgi:hypothetical protein